MLKSDDVSPLVLLFGVDVAGEMGLVPFPLAIVVTDVGFVTRLADSIWLSRGFWKAVGVLDEAFEPFDETVDLIF